jgi:hypothetical protein
MKHCMVDLETLGTVADSVIMSIGAVKFDLDSDAVDDDGFYASVSVDSNLESRRRIQEDTLMWWIKQSADAKQVFHEPKQTLSSALVGLADWLGDASKIQMWSNGADFDLPMLAHAYVSLGMEVPWKFWNNRCFRTFKNLPQARLAVFNAEGVAHNALVDALNQARHAQVIQSVLVGKALPPPKHSMVKATA